MWRWGFLILLMPSIPALPNTLLLCLLSGVLLGAAFPPSPFGLLALVGYVPLLMALDQMEVHRRRSVVAHLYVTFFVYHGITNWWVMSWQEQTDPYLMASGAALWLGHPFFLMLPFLALSSIRRRLGGRLGRNVSIWLTPLSITGFEWLHGQTDASYPWLTSGYMLIDTPLAQVADYIGVYGLTFLIAVVNTLLVQRRYIPAVVMVVVWALLGFVNQQQYQPSKRGGSTIQAALVQPNENPWDKWSDPRRQVAQQQHLVDSIRWQGARPDLVVWAETAIPYTIREAPYLDDFQHLRSWVDTSRIALLTGFADRVVYPAGQAPPSARVWPEDPTVRYDHFNAAMSMQAGGGVVGVHHKSMLTPFAERLPFADQLTFAMSWIEWGVGISAWGKGTTRLPLPIITPLGDTVGRVGTIICIESIYPEVARDMVASGADVLAVITNDAWYNGTWGPAQHFCIARMRAIEQRRDVLRCAMSGETGIIRADGSTAYAMPALTRGVLQGTVQPMTVITLYNQLGDILPPVALVVVLLALVLGLVAARFPNVVRNMQIRHDTSFLSE